MTILKIDNLSFSYDNVDVLRNISFSIENPSFVCIVGPNGVGKSTLIRCINRLLRPSSGTVSINGKNVNDYTMKELAKVVGYVPSSSREFNIMTVLDTVLIGRYIHQTWRTSSEDINSAYKALEAMEIENLAMRKFNELSAGQHQKVTLARGLVQETEILLLDEPTSNLDIRHQMYVMEFLKKFSRKSHITVIMISHDLNLSAKFADEILVMAPPGIMYGYGKPSEVITREMIREVYNVDCDIVEDHGTPHIMLESVVFDR